MDIRRWGAWSALLVMPAIAWAAAQVGLEFARGLVGAWRAEDVLLVLAAFSAAALAAYLGIVGLSILAAALVTGLRWPGSIARLAPPAWRAVAGLALGVTIATGAGTAAIAENEPGAHVGWIPGPGAVTQESEVATPATTTPLVAAFPGADVVPSPTVAAATSPLAPVSAATYTVVRGDSLWGITVRLLGPSASDAEIAQAWPQLYHANRGVIGSDPSLIFAGQVLQIPSGIQ